MILRTAGFLCVTYAESCVNATAAYTFLCKMLGEYLLVGYQDQEYVISDGCVGGVGPRTIILGIAKLAPQLREKSSRIRPPIQNSQPVHLNDGGSNKGEDGGAFISLPFSLLLSWTLSWSQLCKF